jgi:hypothetical protein
MQRIEIVKGDITLQRVDAIVNPANSSFLDGDVVVILTKVLILIGIFCNMLG